MKDIASIISPFKPDDIKAELEVFLHRLP